MPVRILNPSEEHLWSGFVRNHPLGDIHQSPEWGRFQAAIPGRAKYWIIVLEEDLKVYSSSPKILAGTLLIQHKLPHGYCWLYSPRGPLLDDKDLDDYSVARMQMSALLDEIKRIAKEEKAIFLRVDPLFVLPVHFEGFHDISYGFQPQHTLTLNISMGETELLAQMKPKGRYNIKLAEKKGVIIRKSDPSNQQQYQKDLADFYKILTETTTRDGFHGHDLKFYENMLGILDSYSTLYLAEYENKIISGAINICFMDMATYYYGASSNTHRNLMAPYLLQWHAIKDARTRGCNYYDFFGIAPQNSKNHPWEGVTEFKKKFGGEEISHQKAKEFVFRKNLYLLYKLYKKLK